MNFSFTLIKDLPLEHVTAAPPQASETGNQLYPHSIQKPQELKLSYLYNRNTSVSRKDVISEDGAPSRQLSRPVSLLESEMKRQKMQNLGIPTVPSQMSSAFDH